MSAGQDVEIALAARDAYGNAVVDMEPSALRAAADGTAGAVRFQAVEVSTGQPGGFFAEHKPASDKSVALEMNE